MNCWFCSLQLLEDHHYCESSNCRPYYVTYVFHEIHNVETYRRELYKVQFKATLYNKDYKSRDYFVNYLPQKKLLEVVEQITPPFDPENESPWISYSYKTVLEVPYETPTITPSNFKTKLPLLLILS